ncbi:ndufs4 NADH dehydrogenase Fe-S protein subunit [Dimargaris cristalligena]|nr:ndufs4 NADH dehydrogenase Fe-S protein subunit [Dimargaris cristalligena]
MVGAALRSLAPLGRLSGRTLSTSARVATTTATSGSAVEKPGRESKSVVDPTAGGALVHADVVSGAPVELHSRMVRIFKPTKSAMQSGTAATQNWRVDFDVIDHGDRWENQLMGWASSADYMQAIRMKFKTKEAAVEFAEKQGWNYYVQEPKVRAFKPKVYAENFSYSPNKLRLIRTK